MELNKIYNQDCLDGMQMIGDKSIDCIICDLPYGTTACKWDSIIPIERLWEQYERIITDVGAIVLFGQEPFSSFLRMSNTKLYRYDWIWEKQRPSNFQLMNYQCGRVHETISVFSKSNACYSNGKPTMTYYPQTTQREKTRVSTKNTVYGNNILHNYNKSATECDEKKSYDVKQPTSIIKFNTVERGKIHPTQKPVELVQYLVRTYTKEGDVALDNCMGSGTTAIACIREGRNFIGFETNAEYYEKSLDRINEEITKNETDNKQKQLF